MTIIKMIINSIKKLFRRKSAGYVNIHEAREAQKYKEYFGKRKY